MLVGRIKEQAELLSLMEKEESQFCVVYGRRRIGKTFLIRETFANRFAFQHTGLANAPKAEQLKEFRESLRAAGMPRPGTPRTWYEAFRLLAAHLSTLQKGKKVVFIDELSWLDTPKSDFVSALEHFWNGWATARPEKDIVLIVCGSATSWLINKIIRNHGGLHNRLTMSIHLQPFTLRECEQYAQSLRLEYSRADLIEAFMIMGGVPYYWSFLRKGESLSQSIDRIFFAQDAPLADEYVALYASLFRNPEPHMAIIETLSGKKSGMTRKELLLKTKMSDNKTFSKVLEELEQCNFIRRYQSFEKKNRDSLFQLMDNFTLFYFRYMKANAFRDEHFWSHNIDTPQHDAWAGLAFERVCLWHLPQMRRALGIEGVASTAFSWRTNATEEHPGTQIDLLIDRGDNIINLCEMKFSYTEYVITKEEDSRLRTRKSLFKAISRTRKSIHLTFVTTYGLLHNKYSGSVQKEIVMDDLFVDATR